jgi:hypothetical protein
MLACETHSIGFDNCVTRYAVDNTIHITNEDLKKRFQTVKAD